MKKEKEKKNQHNISYQKKKSSVLMFTVMELSPCSAPPQSITISPLPEGLQGNDIIKTIYTEV